MIFTCYVQDYIHSVVGKTFVKFCTLYFFAILDPSMSEKMFYQLPLSDKKELVDMIEALKMKLLDNEKKTEDILKVYGIRESD